MTNSTPTSPPPPNQPPSSQPAPLLPTSPPPPNQPPPSQPAPLLPTVPLEMIFKQYGGLGYAVYVAHEARKWFWDALYTWWIEPLAENNVPVADVINISEICDFYLDVEEHSFFA